MIPDGICNILSKYDDQISEEISVINLSIERIKDSLNNVNQVIATNLCNHIKNGSLEKHKTEQEYLNDSYVLRKYIETLHKINIQINKTTTNNTRNLNSDDAKLNIHDIIVISNIKKCVHDNHNITDYVVEVPVLYNDTNIRFKSVLVSYCKECNRFVMLKDSYKQIDGIILCQIIDMTTVSESNNDDDNDLSNIQKHSILYEYGYSVSKQNDIPEKVRRIILSLLIESQIMTRSEIINHINSLISRGEKRTNWEEAICKWNQDKKYISEYKSCELPICQIKNIILKYNTITE